MSTKKKSSTENASVEITQEMIKKYGLVFMADFISVPLKLGRVKY